MRIIFFGMGGVFSRAPLEALLRAGVDLRAVVEPAPEELAGAEPFTRLEPSRWAASGAARRGLPMASMGSAKGSAAQTIRDLAASVGAPTYSVRRLRDARFLAEMAAYQPDAICVACFTKRLPQELLAIPRLGALNAHPSLLPMGRGPDPLFWFFRSNISSAGEAVTGITIHLMDNFLDGGPILIQKLVGFTYYPWYDLGEHNHNLLEKTVGFNRYEEKQLESEAQLEAFLGSLAGDMFVEALAGLAEGTLKPEQQDDTEATYEDWPQPEDYTIDARDKSWTYRRAYVFAHGVAGRSQPVVITAQDGARFQTLSGTEPLDYMSSWYVSHPGHRDHLDYRKIPWQLVGAKLDILLTDGVFTCLAERLD
jgi:methionyl-tRNA formyltransferase